MITVAIDFAQNPGGLSSVYDVKGWPDYAIGKEDSKPDSAAITRLVAKSNFRFRQRAARVGIFHQSTPEDRTQLMIIYGEALPGDTRVPLRREGVDLLKESPQSSSKI